MSYTKHNFKSGDKLYASALNEMDEQIYANEQAIADCQPKGDYVTETKVDEKIAQAQLGGKEIDLSGYLTEEEASQTYQSKGDYATNESVDQKISEAQLGGKEVDLSGYAKTEDIPTKVSELTNDKSYATEEFVAQKIAEAQLSGGGTGTTPDAPGGTAYAVGLLLTNCSSSNNAASVAEGSVYVTQLTANDGYLVDTPVITMGGEVITDTAWNASSATITIMSVTGDIIIECVALSQADTTAVIAQSGVGYGSTMVPTAYEGMAITKVYEFTPDLEKFKADSNLYDSTNDYAISAGTYGSITVYTPGIKRAAAGLTTSGITNKASKIVFTKDGEPVTYFSNSSLTASADPTMYVLRFPRQSSKALYANGIVFTISEYDIDDSYAYWNEPEEGYVFPIGVRGGDVIFAGKNTPYYGLANIDGTELGETANAGLSYDDDIAMNYGIATTSMLGEPLANDPSNAYGLSNSFATVINDAKLEWMTEYGGDYRKIPIIVSTDQHGRRNSGIFKMLDKTVSWHDVSKVINLGDTISTWYDADTEYPLRSDSGLDSWMESIKDIPFSKRLDVYGNHDTWYGNYSDEGNAIGTRYPSDQKHLHQYFRNIYARRTNNNGWFVVKDDYFNVKYLAISAFEYKGSVTFRIGTEQMNFIIDELTKNDGYDIVIVSHVPLRDDPTLNFYPTGQTSTNTDRVSAINTDAFFAARKNGGSGTITDSDGVEHTYDFSGCTSQLLCSLHGHTHYDCYLYLGNLLVNSFDWFDDNTFFMVLIDRVNEYLNVWKISAPNDVPQCERYQIPFNPTAAE